MATVQSIKPRSNDDAERTNIALQASWEAEQCAHTALELLEDAGVKHLAARSLVIRLRELASISMSALDDEMESVQALRGRLTGVRVPGAEPLPTSRG